MREIDNREKKRVSEAGNRTPVVRVTGGNTKPLYYFGPVSPPSLHHIFTVSINKQHNQITALPHLSLQEAARDPACTRR